MLNLLNAVGFFGIVLDWNSSKTKGWIAAIVVVLAIVVVALIISLVKLVKKLKKGKVASEEAQPAPVGNEVTEPVVVSATAPTVVKEREVIYMPATEPKAVIHRTLTGISLDTGIVKRTFELGEDFSCDGLLVNANYNLEPTTQTILGFTVLDSAEYDKLEKKNKLNGCYVLKPNLNKVGIEIVAVKYENKTAIYTINVSEPKKEEPKAEPAEPYKPQVVETILIGEESVEAGRLRYDKSFEARLIQSDDEVKHWYTEIKNELLSYKTCKGRMSWKRETFKAKKEVVAKLVYRGNTLCLFVPLKAEDYPDHKDIESTDWPTYEDTPVFIRLKNEKRVRIAKVLIGKVMAERDITRGSHISEDFFVPYEGIVELINKGLIKREIRDVADEAIFDRDKKPEEA